MGLFKILLIFSALAASGSLAYSSEEQPPAVDRRHIFYHMQKGNYNSAFDLYRKYLDERNGIHDIEALQNCAFILLEEGVKNPDPETQLLSIYGCGIGNCSASISILESGIKSSNPTIQLASLRFLSTFPDDRSEELLNRAMNSPFFYTRLEAAYILAQNKSRSSVGQIEGLMQKLPSEAHYFFPELFALNGSHEAMSILKRLMNGPNTATKIEALLSAARYHRDDMLPVLRTHATHTNIAELEASASALGILKDAQSIPLLRKLAEHREENIALAASLSLYALGEASALQKISQLATQGSLFALHACGEIPGTEDLLLRMSNHPNVHVRLNAVLSLLQRRDPRCTDHLAEFLFEDEREMGFQPQVTLGRSLVSWKMVSSVGQMDTMRKEYFRALAVNFRERMLQLALELPHDDFLKIARFLLERGQMSLVPVLVQLLENIESKEALKLLMTHAERTGFPLLRAYCHLALYRMQYPGFSEQYLLDFIHNHQEIQIVQFRPSMQRELTQVPSIFELTPEEKSRFLIETYEAIADKKEEKSIQILVEALAKAEGANRFILAGILLRALQ
jgi:HEAT repeat protein